MRNLYWLDDLGAVPLSDLHPNADSFLFAGARSIEDYRKLTAAYLQLHDAVDERLPLLNLDSVLFRMEQQNINVYAPATWIWEFDCPIPRGIQYPVFVRAAKFGDRCG